MFFLKYKNESGFLQFECCQCGIHLSISATLSPSPTLLTNQLSLISPSCPVPIPSVLSKAFCCPRRLLQPVSLIHSLFLYLSPLRVETGGWGESEGQVHNLPEALYRGEERLGWLEGGGKKVGWSTWRERGGGVDIPWCEVWLYYIVKGRLFSRGWGRIKGSGGG